MTAYKLMLLGEIGVGKTSLVRRLVLDRFDFDYKPTIGVDVYRYDVPPRDGRAATSLIIWDTDGNFGEAIFRHVYMKEAAAALIVADVTRADTINSMVALGRGFRDAFPGRHCAYIVNKLDLVSDDDRPELPAAMMRPGVEVTQTSAKTGSNVEAAFHRVATTIARRS